MNKSPGWLRCITGLSVLTVLVSIALIAAGVFDPKTVGQQQWKMELASHQIPAGSRQTVWLDSSLPDQAYSLRLTASYLDGDVDNGYGLVVGDQDHHLAVAVSSLGYVSIWRHDSQPGRVTAEPSFILPWQTWPHVRSGQQINEIWIDHRGTRITVRINQELLWEGDAGRFPGRVGLVGESFRDTASIRYVELQLFTDQPVPAPQP